jgi:hypothetical protein
MQQIVKELICLGMIPYKESCDYRHDPNGKKSLDFSWEQYSGKRKKEIKVISYMHTFY